MRLLVCGSRNWNAPARVAEVLASQVPRPTLIISGLAAGPDALAYMWAASEGIERIGMAPDWARYGRAAGMKRNAQMLALKPDKVLAFWDGRSRGTRNMIEIARNGGVPVEIVVMPKET
jgi:hypothetical protein